MAEDNALTFYFDFISPYAYLGWKQITDVAARHHRELVPKPILFAALLSHHGNKGPAEIPPKRIHMIKNVIRMAHDRGITFIAPSAHPFNPLLALRAASTDLAENKRLSLIDAIYDVVWGGASVDGERDVTNPKIVAAIANRIGLDGAKIVEAAASSEVKDRVRVETEDAIARGVFGVPTILANDELFWGADSIPHLEAHLRGEDPATAERTKTFLEMPVGANRKPS